MIDLRRARLFGALSLSAVLVIACGGGTAPTAPEASQPTASAAASEGPPAVASEAPPSDGALPSIGAIPSFDLGALSGTLPGVDSYQTSVSLNGEEQYHTVVVTEPEVAKSITIFDGGEPGQRIVIIGDEAWVADGPNGTFESVPSQLANAMIFDPALMLGGFTGVDWGTAGSNLGTEEKNGVQAVHLRVDSTTAAGLGGQIPPGAAVDVWVAEAGHLVAWEMSGFPEDANFSIQVTNINDPANQVERPA